MAKPKLKIKKGDKVILITGKRVDADGEALPTRGEVIQVFPAENRVVVRGVNMVKRHQKQSAQQDGGVIEKEAPIHISNVALEDPKDGQPTRIGYKFLDDGRKVRFAKRSGELIDG